MKPFVIAWLMGFIFHMAVVLVHNARAKDEDQYPAAFAIFIALWPALYVLALIGVVIEFLDDVRDAIRGPR